MKLCLFITYHDEAETWPFLRTSVDSQTRAPDQIVLAIDDADTPTPHVSGLRGLSIVRPLPEVSGLYGYGPIIHRAMQQIETEYVIHIDADCLMHPRFIEGYYAVFSRGVRGWSVTSTEGRVIDVWPAENERTVWVGPNTYAPLPSAGLDYGVLCADTAFGVRRPYGQRGHADGRASLHGCNWATHVSVLDQTHWPRRTGRTTDAEWAGNASGAGVRFRPAPDDCCVVAHVGPETSGRGPGLEDHGGWCWTPPAYPTLPADR